MRTDETDQDQPGAERRLSFARYRHVVTVVFLTPWAVLEATHAVIRDVVKMHVAGERLTAEEVEERIGAGPARKPGYQAGAVAVIPLYGVIMPRADVFTQISGGTSLEMVKAAIEDAAADPAVGAILLDVDSPGGSVALVPETAAAIRAARARKPVVAVANTMAASAAYWLAAQADELIVTPSGSVGSVGVFAAHDDLSALQEKMGVKTTLISAGKYKTEGNPYEPLSDEARQAIQDDVDAFYAMFKADVAKGRGDTVATVEANYGQGRMVMAKDAVAAGMADRVDTFDGALARAASGKVVSRSARALADASAEFPGAASLEVQQSTEEDRADEPEQDREPDTVSEPARVDGAERLLARPSVREHFAPA